MSQIVVAIVSDPRGVLIGKRLDGVPPWTFPGGKVEPGETPPAAAGREVREETGMDVVVVGELGRRIHPRTGRTVIYLAAHPVTAADPRADGRELVALRWARLPELEQLMPDLFEPVRVHLARDAVSEVRHLEWRCAAASSARLEAEWTRARARSIGMTMSDQPAALQHPNDHDHATPRLLAGTITV